MKLRQLFEGLGQEVAIIFGRFNPPHKGHRAAWELAAKSPIWYVGTNESTVGPKDPLPYGVKVEAMTTIWPEVEGHIIAETSWLTLASLVYEKHGDVTLLCLTDEDWVTKTIVQYNGKEGAHGFYKFKQIKQKPTPRLSSATALRDAVTKGDREAFSDAAGVPADTPVAGKPFFDLVAEYLLPYSNAPKKVAKKKVAAPVEGVTENYHSDLMKQTYAKFFKPAPPKTVASVKKFLSEVIVSLGTAQDNDYDEENPEEISWGQDLSDVREAYNKLRSNGSPNWFDLADAVLSYDTEFRESMIEWAEEDLGSKLVDLLWNEVWEAKHQISRSGGSYNVDLNHKGVAEDNLTEFAPGGDDGGDEEDTLLKFARMWYKGDEATQQKVEQALARQGWEIGELESEEGGAFVIRAGDENGDSYIGFAVADLEEDVTEATLGSVLEWPEVANKVNSAMKAMGWKGQRKGDDAFMFSTKGQETDDQFYFVIIENEGNGMFHYALGTVEDGDPYIDDAHKGNLPNTEASVSELMNDIREGFGLHEDAAGVGIITKQNSTVDVNKGTPRKNLKAFRLVK